MAALANASTDVQLSTLLRLLIISFIFSVNAIFAEDILLSFNLKKPIALTSDKFLSYTLDPADVLTGNVFTENMKKSVNMAKALSPAYVRIGGPRSNSYTFVSPHNSHQEEDPNFTITETNWIDVHRWAKNAGLEILACIAPQHIQMRGRDSVWDSRNALDLISFTDLMGFNTSWQLGYECQTRCDAAGIDIGKAVVQLRSMLNAYPRYSRSILTGPDVVAYRTRQQQEYLQDYLDIAGNALSAITWHPNFSGITLDADGPSMHQDNLAIDREILFKVLGRSMMKKDLWLAESKPEQCKKQFLGALVWTRRLGNAAKLGVQVIMRQPSGSNLLQPSPDYWVSVLHKALVGREVIDVKIMNDNHTHVHFYSQCTKPSSKYEKGSLTIFGINLTPNKLFVNLKGLKVKTIHRYILMPGFDAEHRMYAETVLLNNEPLRLVDDQELPEIKPAISRNGYLKLPSGGIGFWVLPDLKIKSCGGDEEDNTDKTSWKKASKRLGESRLEEEMNPKDVSEVNKNGETLSTEEHRFSSKSSKDRRRRKHRYIQEDDLEKHYEGTEAATDLQKLKKILRRRDNFGAGKSSPRGRAHSREFDGENSKRLSGHDDFDKERTEGIENKILEYKKRLENKMVEMESRLQETTTATTEIDDTIDSEKVMEAMKLISKMESALKKLELSDEDVDKAIMDQEDIDEVTRSVVTSENGSNSDEAFFDELVKSKKMKRTSVPTKIEDQLEKIYQMLAEEKERRHRNKEKNGKNIKGQHDVGLPETREENFSRSRRETEKRFGIDPLGLRKEGLYRRLSRLNDETRERRIDRRNRRKDNPDSRRDEENGTRDRKMVLDSEENTFYGFPKRGPVKNFPQGDVHLVTEDSIETKLTDASFEKKISEMSNIKGRTRSSRKNEMSRLKVRKDTDTLNKQTENPQPIELFENVNMAANPRPNKDQKINSELSEAELTNKKMNYSSNTDVANIATIGRIVQEQIHDIHEDEKVRESAIEKVISYYENEKKEMLESEDKESSIENTGNYVTTPTIADVRKSKFPPSAYLQNSVAKKKRNKERTSGEYKKLPNNDSIGKSSVSSAEEEAFGNYNIGAKTSEGNKKRSKRSAVDTLKNVLDREMIFEDDDNFKDCGCRVTRKTKTIERPVNIKSEKRRNRGVEKSPVRKMIDEINERRKNRKNKESLGKESAIKEATMKEAPTPRPISNIIERIRRPGRPKREAVNSSAEKMAEVTTDEPEFIYEDSVKEEPSTTEQMKIENSTFAKTDSRTISLENDHSEREDSTKKNIENLDTLPQEKHEEKNSNSLTYDEEIMNVSQTNKVAKRHNKDETTKKDRRFSMKPEVKDSSIETITVETLTLEDALQLEEERSETTKTPNPKFFRGRKSKKERTKKSEENKETTESDITDTRIVPTVEVPATSSSKIINKPIDAAKTKTSERENTDKKTSTGNEVQEKPEEPALEVRTKKTESEKRKLSKSLSNDTITMKKPLRRMKKASKITSPTKQRGIQLPARSSVLSTTKKDGELKKKKKSKRTEQLEKLQERLRQKREEFVNDYDDDSSIGLEETSDEKKNLHQSESVDTTIKNDEFNDLVDSEKYDYLQRNRPINYEALEDVSILENAEDSRKKYVPTVTEIVRPHHLPRERKIQQRVQTVGATTDPKLSDYNIPKESSTSEVLEQFPKEDPKDHRIQRRHDKSPYSSVEVSENTEFFENVPSSNGEKSDEEFREELENYTESAESIVDLSSTTVETIVDLSSADHESYHNCDESKEFHYLDDLPEEVHDKILDSDKEENKDLKMSGDSQRFVRKIGHRNCMCAKKNSEELSSEDSALKSVNEEHFTTIPIDSTRIKTTNRQQSRKRNLKNSDYDQISNYDNPKYARLAPEKIVRKNMQDQDYPRLLNSEEISEQDIGERSWIIRRIKGNTQRKKWPTIDYVDLEEALNSRNYELLMLIPVNKNEKRSRQRRQVNNELIRDSEYPAEDNVPIEIMPRNDKLKIDEEEKKKEKITEDEISIIKNNAIDQEQTPIITILNRNKNNDNPIASSSTMSLEEQKKKSLAIDEKMLQDYMTNEIVQSEPDNISYYDKKSKSDGGLPDLIEEAIPKLESTLTGGLSKARRISESFEKFMEDFDDRFNKEGTIEKKNDNITADTNVLENNLPISSNIFDNAFSSLKKFFDFFSGFVHAMRFN